MAQRARSRDIRSQEAEKGEGWCPAGFLLFSPFHMGACGRMSPTFKVGCPISINLILESLRPRLVSMVILNLLKWTVKINYGSCIYLKYPSRAGGKMAQWVKDACCQN